MKKIKLNLGSGIYCPRGWISVDKFLDEEGIKTRKGYYKNAIWENGAKFIKADILELPFPDNYADLAEMHEVLEHFPFRKVVPALTEVRRVLKKGGKLILSCPSFEGICLDYLDMSINWDFNIDRYLHVTETIFGNQTGTGEFHCVPFNRQFINFCIVQAGFRNGKIGLYKKGVAIPQVGELGRADNTKVLRNDMIVAEVIK